MTTPALTARLKHLTDSAHLLAGIAPESSAYLMSQCNKLMFDNEINPPASHRKHVCGACGNIMILGWTSTMQMKKLRPREGRRKVRRKEEGTPEAQQARELVYSCDVCDRKTRLSINIPSPAATRRHKPSIRLTELQRLIQLPTPSPLPAAGIESPSPISANASSKKRAKIRKLGGLQALLAAKKEKSTNTTPRGFGLDLLDLMKKA